MVKLSFLPNPDYDIVMPHIDLRGKPAISVNGLIPVVKDSSLRLRKAVARISYYFCRELHYLACSLDEGSFGKYDVAFLWPDINNNNMVAVGACYFHYHEWSDELYCEWDDELANWSFVWVWLHPYERRMGHLSAAWPQFRERFNDFAVEYPLSRAMKAFLKKTDKRCLLRW